MTKNIKLNQADIENWSLKNTTTVMKWHSIVILLYNNLCVMKLSLYVCMQIYEQHVFVLGNDLLLINK